MKKPTLTNGVTFKDIRFIMALARNLSVHADYFEFNDGHTMSLAMTGRRFYSAETPEGTHHWETERHGNLTALTAYEGPLVEI